jgi:DNA-binding CsgD family transcriptional regulator
MPDSVCRSRLMDAFQERGHSVESVSRPIDVHRSVHKEFECLLIGTGDTGASIVDWVLICRDELDPKVCMVLVDAMIFASEARQMKLVGVNAILSAKLEPTTAEFLVGLLPGHWMIDMSIVTPEGLQSDQILTRRERDVLKLMHAGFSGKEIAKIRRRSHATIRRQRLSAMKKLNIRSPIGLVKWFSANEEHSAELSIDSF